MWVCVYTHTHIFLEWKGVCVCRFYSGDLGMDPTVIIK
jgi:hypothetical protein